MNSLVYNQSCLSRENGNPFCTIVLGFESSSECQCLKNKLTNKDSLLRGNE
jgi:hypothetical protein